MGRMRNIVLCMLVFAVLTGVAIASVTPNVQLQSYTVNETPLQPGHVVNLTLQLNSTEWDNCADEVSVQLITSYPLSIQGPDTNYLGRLCYQDASEKQRTSFLIPVDPLAQVGTDQITVIINYQQYFVKYTNTNTLNLRVGGYPSFQASVVSSNPIDIYPGDSSMVTLMLYNNGTDRAESVQVNLVAPQGIEAKWATSTQELGTILSQSGQQATFAVEADKDTQPGNYRMELDVNYISSSGQQRVYEFPFALVVTPKAEFNATGSSVPLYAGQTQDSTIVLRNTGTQEARELKVRIQPVFPFSSDGTVRYVDSLAPGQEVNLTYSLSVDSSAEPGNAQTLTLLIDYEDPQGNQFTDSADFALSVKATTLTEQLEALWYIWAIIVLIILIILVRRLRAKK